MTAQHSQFFTHLVTIAKRIAILAVDVTVAR